MRFHFDRLSPSSLISLKLSLDRPRISGPPLSQVSLLTENGNTKDDLRLPTDDALLPTENSSHDWSLTGHLALILLLRKLSEPSMLRMLKLKVLRMVLV
ncbi:unnamed protein product [Camellia sinensis]